MSLSRLALPLALGGTLAAAAYVATRKKPANAPMKPEEEVIFQTALEKVQDPQKLRALADAFDMAGQHAAAEELRIRASLKELPPEVKLERREAFRKGMQSDNVPAILALAQAFKSEGHTGAAADLERHAKEVATAKEKAAGVETKV